MLNDSHISFSNFASSLEKSSHLSVLKGAARALPLAGVPPGVIYFPEQVFDICELTGDIDQSFGLERA